MYLFRDTVEYEYPPLAAQKQMKGQMAKLSASLMFQ